MTQAKPLQVTIDWEKARDAFWKRYKKQAPRMYEIQVHAGVGFEALWKQISPVMGSEETISMSFNKDGALQTTLAGWVLIGAIGAAGALNAIDESQKLLDKRLKELESRWESKLQAIENRLGPIEEWCGLKQPKGD